MSLFHEITEKVYLFCSDVWLHFSCVFSLLIDDINWKPTEKKRSSDVDLRRFRLVCQSNRKERQLPCFTLLKWAEFNCQIHMENQLEPFWMCPFNVLCIDRCEWAKIQLPWCLHSIFTKNSLNQWIKAARFCSTHTHTPAHTVDLWNERRIHWMFTIYAIHIWCILNANR